MAKEFGCSYTKILWWLKKFNIQRRNKSESLSGRRNPMYGKTHTLENKEKIRKSQIALKHEDAALLALNCGFKLMTEYGGKDSPAEMECINCGEIKKLKQVKNAWMSKARCKNCGTYSTPRKEFVRSRKYFIEDVKNICEKNGIKFLDDFYNGCDYKHRFQCKNEHVWTDSFNEMVRKFNGYRGRPTNGCRKCLYESLKIDIETIKEKLSNKNLFLLDDYINSHSKHEIKCLKCGFAWKCSISSIMYSDSGCPHCNLHLNEKLTGFYLKELLPECEIFPYTLRQKIIINHETIKNRLYIDYSFAIGNNVFFVEYNGIQHYEEVNFGNYKTDLNKQIIRDEWLRSYCFENNIYLIEIDGRKYKKESIKDYLISIFKSIKIPVTV